MMSFPEVQAKYGLPSIAEMHAALDRGRGFRECLPLERSHGEEYRRRCQNALPEFPVRIPAKITKLRNGSGTPLRSMIVPRPAASSPHGASPEWKPSSGNRSPGFQPLGT